MMRADHAPHRKIRDRCIDMRHQMQPSRTDPRSLDDDVGEVDRDQLTDFGAAVDAWYQFQIDLRLGQCREGRFAVACHRFVFVAHGAHGDELIGVFDATILLGLGGEDKEPLIAALLMFRFLYHFLPFVLALALFGAVEGWRGLRAKSLLQRS